MLKERNKWMHVTAMNHILNKDNIAQLNVRLMKRNINGILVDEMIDGTKSMVLVITPYFFRTFHFDPPQTS